MRYRLTTLEPLPGYKISVPTAINIHGRIVGYSQKNEEDESIPTIWISGKPRKLTSDYSGEPLDINDKNEVLFSSHIRLSSGKEIDLIPERRFYEATAINNKSRVVGIERPEAHDWAAAHYSNGRWNRLEHFEWEGSDARDINDEGVVAGWYAGEKSGWSAGDACIWVNGHRRLLGCLPDQDSGHALCINNRNQVVGFCYEAAQHVRHGKLNYRAFFWQRGRMRDLGALKPDAESSAQEINDNSIIVGWSNRSRHPKDILGPGLPIYAVVWHRFLIIDLNTIVKVPSGFSLTRARQINNRNEITGIMTDSKQQIKGFLLTPY